MSGRWTLSEASVESLVLTLILPRLSTFISMLFCILIPALQSLSKQRLSDFGGHGDHDYKIDLAQIPHW